MFNLSRTRPSPFWQPSVPKSRWGPMAKPIPLLSWPSMPSSAIYTATPKTENPSSRTAHLSMDGCPPHRWAWTTATCPSGRPNLSPRWSPPWQIPRPSSKD